MEMFQYDFMQRAFIAIVAMSLITPILGLLLLLRRQALLADTLSHISLVGVALGLLINVYPTITTILVVVVISFIIEYLRQIYKSYSELSIAILTSGGLSLSILLMHLKKGTSVKVDQYLFGSLVTISIEQLVILCLLAMSIVLLYLIFRKPLYVMLFDEDTAFTSGLPTQLISVVFSVITGITISVMMPIAGTLLVSSILILPTAISMRLFKNFTPVILGAGVVSFISMFVGLYLSYQYNLPPGATITMLFIIILMSISLIFRKK